LMFRSRPADQPVLSVPALSRLSGAVLIVLSVLIVWWGIFPAVVFQLIQSLLA
jgi:hypothetical protein